jgi:cell division protein FtsB
MTERQRRRWMRFLLFGIPILGYALFSSRGIFARLSLEWESYAVRRSVESARQEQDSLRSYIDRLMSDTALIERIAREKYGMVKPREQVYIVQEENQENDEENR